MYCPNCGKKISARQQFCRFCGLALEQIAKSLAEQRPIESDKNLSEKKERLEALGFAALCVCGLGILSIVIYKAVQLFMAGNIWGALGVLVAVVIVGCGLLATMLFEHAKELDASKHKNRLGAASEVSPEEAITARLLPDGMSEPVPSVTERTTELLYAEKRGSGE